MQAYKIKVANEAESKEAQSLFFELGYDWRNKNKSLSSVGDKFIFAEESGILLRREDDEGFFNRDSNQEITLPQLRDLAVLHRNDVSDATHTFGTADYYVGCEVYHWKNYCDTWGISEVFNLSDVSSRLIPITKGQPQMTWQDALRAVADGKEVEFLSFENGEWEELATIHLGNIVDADCEFRLKPQTVFIDAGHYTKEELLKFAGEMA